MNIENIIDNTKWHIRYDDQGEIVLVKDPVFKKEQEIIILKNKIKESQLPLSIIDYDIKSYVGKDVDKNLTKINQYIDKFEDKFKNISLYFWSKENSTQKTTIASFIGKELIKKGFSVYFILMSTLVKLLSTIETNDENSRLINHLLSVDYLIIDDAFDTEKSHVYKSKWQLPFIDEFLRSRLEINKKATCFTSNVDIDAIMNSYNKSIYALIKRNVSVMNFKDSVFMKNNFDIESIWD